MGNECSVTGLLAYPHTHTHPSRTFTLNFVLQASWSLGCGNSLGDKTQQGLSPMHDTQEMNALSQDYSPTLPPSEDF